MKLLNIQKMIEDTVVTGEPVTDSVMLGGKEVDEEKGPIIDTEPVSTSWSPTPSPHASGSRFVSGNYRHTPPALGHTDRAKSVGRHTSTESPGIAKEVQSALAKIDGSGLPSDMCSPDKASIFHALVEFEFSILSKIDKIEVVRMLGCDVTNTWPPNGKWNVVNRQEFDSIIALAVRLINRGRNEAALVVGKLLGLKPEYCFRTFPQTKDDIPSVHAFRNPQVEDLIPKLLVVLGRTYELTHIHYLRDFRGIKEGAVCDYVDSANPQNSFYLPATRVEMDGKLTLRIGAAPVPARLFARDQMAQVEGATVLFCQDTRIAMEMSRIANEARLFENHGIIISGCSGGATAFLVLKFNDFAGQNVVLLLESTREALIDAPKWVECCEKGGAMSVRIYPWPVIAGEDSICDKLSAQDQWKDMLMENAVRLKDVELPSKFARSVCEKSLTRSDFEKWLNYSGLVPSENNHVDNDLHDEDDIQFVCLKDLPDDDPDDSEPVTLESMFNHEDCTFMWAPTDVGKSWASLEFGLGLATGTKAFGIPAQCPHVVGIMDGEISTRKKNKHVRQLLQNRPELVSLAKSNLHILPPSGKLKRFNEEFADRLVPKLHKFKIEVLILDNLQALDPDSGQFNAKDLFAFVRRMKLKGIAVFIIHHSDKEGKNYKGPTTLVDLSQTVFRGEGVEEVRKLVLDDPDKKHVLEACDEGGPVLRLTITKGKVGGMKRKSVIYHLPIGGVWTHLEGDLVPSIEPLPVNVSAESDDNSVIPVPEDMLKMHDLTPDQEKVYAFLKEKNYTRPQLEAVTGFKADKLGGILRKLIELNLVKPGGAGKATYYRCV
jgi:hypothetical protein